MLRYTSGRLSNAKCVPSIAFGHLLQFVTPRNGFSLPHFAVTRSAQHVFPSLTRSSHDERIKVEEMGHLSAVSVTEFKLENYSNWRKIALRQASRFFVEFIAIRPKEQRISSNRSIHDDSVDWRRLSLLLFLIGHRFIHHRGDSLCLHSMHFLAMRLARQIPSFIHHYFAWMKLASHESLCHDVNVVMHFHVSICLRRNM